MLAGSEFRKNIKVSFTAAGAAAKSEPATMQEDRDDPTAVLLQLKDTLSKQQDAFPIYRDMFKYPAFLKEVLSFGRECLLWGIQEADLPADNDNEKELQKILAVVFSMDLAEKKTFANHDAILAELSKQDITLWPAFYNREYQYAIFQQLAKIFPYTCAHSSCQ